MAEKNKNIKKDEEFFPHGTKFNGGTTQRTEGYHALFVPSSATFSELTVKDIDTGDSKDISSQMGLTTSRSGPVWIHPGRNRFIVSYTLSAGSVQEFPIVREPLT